MSEQAKTLKLFLGPNINRLHFKKFQKKRLNHNKNIHKNHK
jgi:hypothetical protein